MTNEEKASVLEELYAYLCGEPGKEAPEYNRMREAMQAAISSLRSVPAGEPLTPCDVCKFSPPSSSDGKPCCMCPAERRPPEGESDETE